MRGLLLALLLLAAPALAQPISDKYGPGDCPFGASGCQAKATGSTAQRTLGGRASQCDPDGTNCAVFNVKDFYNAVTCNWDCAFDAAFAAIPSIGGKIYAPAGVYTWLLAHTWNNKPVHLFGDGKGVTYIGMSQTSTGLTINETGNNAIFNRTSISDITFTASAAGGPTLGAIAINYPNGVNFPASFGYSTFRASHIEILSSTGAITPTWANSFTHGMTLKGVWNATLQDIHYFGQPASPAGVAGSYGIGLAESENISISDLYAQYGEAGVMILDHGEGLTLNNPIFIGTDYGIEVSGSATPWGNQASLIWNLIQVTKGEFATYIGSLKLNLVRNLIVEGTHNSRFGASGASWIWVDITDSNYSNVSNNQLDGGGTASQNYGSKITSSVYGAAHNSFALNTMSAANVANPATYVKAGAAPDPTFYNYVQWLDANGLVGYGNATVTYGDGRFITKSVRLRRTTNVAASGATLTTDGAAVTDLNCINIPTNASYALDILLLGRSTVGDSVAAKFTAGLHREAGNAGSFPNNAAITANSSVGSGTGLTTTYFMGADTTHQCAVFQVIPPNNAQWDWTADVRISGVQN